jgi:hypothetical protein
MTGTKVLVCGLDYSFCELIREDSEVYSRHYRSVDAAHVPTTSDLLRAVRRGYDIIHLFGQVSVDGMLRSQQNQMITGTELMNNCTVEGVKLLWIANENEIDGYIKGFKLPKSMNLIMTLNRQHDKFSTFLDKLLSKASGGEALPSAWAALVPQSAGSWQRDLPECIFAVGRNSVVELLP